jgi:hypothetical protein
MSEQQSSAVSEQPPWWKILADNWRGRKGNTTTGDSVRNSCADELEKVAAKYLATVPQAASSPAEIAQHETLTSRLRGRARYLRNIGEVKSPELMEQAAVALSRLKCQAGTATALDTATVEACAKFIEQHQETIREAATGTERYLAPRKVGNLMGVAYVDGLRALTRLQCQAESAK